MRDGVNWYVHCYNNPLVFVDLDGWIPTPYEAALMADHIYDPYNPQKNLSGGWVFEGVETNTNNWFTKNLTPNGLMMGIYSRVDVDGNKEYALVNKGSSTIGNWINNAQQLTGTSQDTYDSVRIAKNFVANANGSEVTMIGHSKGGAEARMNAFATGANAILFNPATSSWRSVWFSGISSKQIRNYNGNMTTYIVEGEILNKLQGWMTEHFGNVVYLEPKNGLGAVGKHLMEAVLWSLLQKMGDSDCE